MTVPIVPGPAEPQQLAWPPPPKRAGWVAPVVAALLALVVVFGATAVWLAVRSRPAGLAASTTPPPATTVALPPTTTLAGRGDAAAMDACRQAIGAHSDDFDAMMKLGDRAAESSIVDIHIQGALLHDAANIASRVPQSNFKAYLTAWTDVINVLTDLINDCTRNHIGK